MIKAPVDLQELRRRIYRKAKLDKTNRFWGLFVHVAKRELWRRRTGSPNETVLPRALVGQHRVVGRLYADIIADIYKRVARWIHMPARQAAQVSGHSIRIGVTQDLLALNIDLAPTFAEIAGIKTPDFVDGRSLLPILRSNTAPNPWRSSFMIERRGGKDAQREDGDANEPQNALEFNAIRTPDWTYVEYGDGGRELYDLKRDPYQLENIAAKADPALVKVLAVRLGQLAACKAAACRQTEDAPKP